MKTQQGVPFSSEEDVLADSRAPGTVPHPGDPLDHVLSK